MRIRYRILALAAAALLSGCAKESAVMYLPEAEKVTVQIKTKALTGSVVEGVTIEKVRFMLFQNETLLNNYTTSNGTLNVDDSGLFNLAVSPGVYSFAAIINETPELTEKLNAVTKRTDIDGAGFDWQSSALTSGNMPLANLGEIKIQPGTTSGQGVAQLRPVYNSEGGRYKGDFTTASTTASIDMPRVMSQVSVFLRQDDAVTEEIKISNVQVSNIPRYSYLIDQQDTDNTNLNLFNGPEMTISASGGDKVYNSKQYHPFPTAIIAEKSFYKDGADDETKAVEAAAPLAEVETHGVGAAGAVGQGAVAQTDLRDVPVVPQTLVQGAPQSYGVGGVVAGGVEHQQLGPNVAGKDLMLQPLGGVRYRGLIGSGQVGAQIFGLDAEVGQGAGGLHQGAAQQGAPGTVHGQSQLCRRGLGVELSGAVHNETAGAALQQFRLPAQPGEHPVILKILSGLVQRQGKQDTLALELREVLGAADKPDLPACQSTVQHPVQPSLVRRVGEGGIEYSQGHTLTF